MPTTGVPWHCRELSVYHATLNLPLIGGTSR